MKKYKQFDRQKLYHIFCLYKTLMVQLYGIYKNDLILENGIKTCWKCLTNRSSEKQEFVEKGFYK